MEASEVLKLVKDVDGWLSEGEGTLLYSLASECKGKGVIVEIGSWQGKSSIFLGHGSKTGSSVKIYAVDPHIGSSEHQQSGEKVWTFEKFKENINMAGVEDIIQPIVKTSQEASLDFSDPVELIFIDGAHEYEFVRIDIDSWYDKVVLGGRIAFHDIHGDGVRKAIKEIIKEKKIQDIKIVDTILYGTKTEKVGISSNIRNKLKFSLYYFTIDFKQKVKLPEWIKKPLRKIFKKLV